MPAPTMRGLSPRSLVAVLCATGCLGSTYRIPSDELARQASLPAEQRGHRVRAVQDGMFGGPDAPPAAYGDDDLVEFFLHVSTSTHSHEPSGGGSAEEAAVAILAAAVVVTVGLLATEAIRFDGWLALDPEALVLLETSAGPRAVELGELRPEMLAAVTSAYVADDSAHLEKLERAPLDRLGGTYAFHVGTATGIQPDGGGLTLRPELGFFLTPRFGVKLAYEATFGTELQHSVLLHLQWMFAPWAGAWVHGGEMGIAQDSGPIGGGGLILEIPATTRLALEARAGASFVGLEGENDMITSVTLGVAIY